MTLDIHTGVSMYKLCIIVISVLLWLRIAYFPLRLCARSPSSFGKMVQIHIFCYILGVLRDPSRDDCIKEFIKQK